MDNPRVIQGDHSLLTEENKVRWFRQLAPEERLRVLQNHLDLLRSLGPNRRRTDDSYDPAVVRVLRLP